MPENQTGHWFISGVLGGTLEQQLLGKEGLLKTLLKIKITLY